MAVDRPMVRRAEHTTEVLTVQRLANFGSSFKPRPDKLAAKPEARRQRAILNLIYSPAYRASISATTAQTFSRQIFTLRANFGRGANMAPTARGAAHHAAPQGVLQGVL